MNDAPDAIKQILDLNADDTKRKPYGWQVHEDGPLVVTQPHHPRPAVSADTAGVTTRGVLPYAPVNHTVFS